MFSSVVTNYSVKMLYFPYIQTRNTPNVYRTKYIYRIYTNLTDSNFSSQLLGTYLDQPSINWKQILTGQLSILTIFPAIIIKKNVIVAAIVNNKYAIKIRCSFSEYLWREICKHAQLSFHALFLRLCIIYKDWKQSDWFNLVNKSLVHDLLWLQ